MNVLGIDPGFSTLGWAWVEVEEEFITPLACGVIQTEKAKNKVQLRSSEDNIQRAQSIYLHLRSLMRVNSIQLACTETMSWPRNAGVVAKMGIVWGVIAAVCEEEQVPLLQASPVAIKVAMTGAKQATKEVMIAHVKQRWPGLNLPTQKALQEHPVDALGAILACKDSQAWRMMRI
jgi:crossover junction endodeoxyribonuclease RuvC